MTDSRVSAVVFDLDGTLVDTAPDFISAIKRLAAEENQTCPADHEIRAAVSYGAAGLIERCFNLDADQPEFEPLRQRLLQHYTAHIADDSQLFPGMALLLDNLRQHNLSWGIATNKPLRFAEPLLTALALTPDCLICPDHVTATKPDPESLYLAAKQLNCPVQQLIYVGDHQRDIDCGKRAGTRTITAQYGYLTDSDDPHAWGADHLVSNAGAIWPIIHSYLTV